MPLKGVQITASSAKFAWLARHRKSEILGNNGDICLRLMGRFILGKINMSLGVLKNYYLEAFSKQPPRPPPSLLKLKLGKLV